MMPGGSSFRGLIGVAREDITPPPGIHARCWGAATHDTAEGIHRPLTLTCLTFDPLPGGADIPVCHEPQARTLALISADLMSWRSRDDELLIRQPLLDALGGRNPEARLMFCLAHTHSAPSIRTDDIPKPGGHLIPAYQDKLRTAALNALSRARTSRTLATLSWRYGRCDLATNRDFPDPTTHRTLCGHNPASPADDTLLVGRITADSDSRTLATIVNYACHPTTLAWQNRLLSPDYVGALREQIESHTQSPCCFLQGASGDLAPAEQYTGDTTLADRHGRRLAHATLATLESMPAPGHTLAYTGLVESGAPLALWTQQPASTISTTLSARVDQLDLPLKEMPTTAQLEAQLSAATDPVEKERLWRKRAVREVVGDGPTTLVPLYTWRLGDSFLLGHPNEAYSLLQTTLRSRFPSHAIAIMNLTNGSAGYLPPEPLYDTDAYSVLQTPFARGSFELLLSASERALSAML